MLYVGCLVLLFGVLPSLSLPLKNCTESKGPCWCQNDRIYLKLHCEDINEGVIQDPITAEVEDDEVEELREGTFEDFCFSRLILRLSNLKSIDDMAFYDLRNCLALLLITDGKLTEFPLEAIKNLSRLITLSVSGHQIREIPSLRELPLQFLLLWGNRITSLRKDTFPPQLRTLSLGFNSVKKLNGSLLHLKNLIWLFVDNNKITNLSGELSELKSLQKLSVRNNNIEDLSDSFRNLKKMYNLGLSHNRIKKLRNSLHGLFNLKILQLSHNMIRRLHSKEFVDLMNLHELDLSYNQLESVEDAFLHTRNLRLLNLTGNHLHVMDNSFRCLNELRRVDLSYNFLTELDWLLDSEEESNHNCTLRNNRAIWRLMITKNPLRCNSFQEDSAILQQYKIEVQGFPSC